MFSNSLGWNKQRKTVWHCWVCKRTMGPTFQDPHVNHFILEVPRKTCVSQYEGSFIYNWALVVGKCLTVLEKEACGCHHHIPF